MIAWFEKNGWISWIITIVIAGLIFYFSSLTFPAGSGSGSNIYSIFYHIIIFFLFALFLSISLVKGKIKKDIILAIAIGIVYGISDEIHQLFVPGRSSAIFDVFLDSFGILTASVIYLLMLEFRDKK